MISDNYPSVIPDPNPGNMNTRVRDLWIPNHKAWNVHLIHMLFPNQ